MIEAACRYWVVRLSEYVDLPSDRLELAADLLVRASVSHLLAPRWPVERTAAMLTRATLLLLAQDCGASGPAAVVADDLPADEPGGR